MYKDDTDRQALQRFSGQITNISGVNTKRFSSVTLPFTKHQKRMFPTKANLLFCTLDNPIFEHINKAGNFCIYLRSRNVNAYDFQFCCGKEIWIFHLKPEPDEFLIRFAYALLRHGASKVQIQYFPVEDNHHA